MRPTRVLTGGGGERALALRLLRPRERHAGARAAALPALSPRRRLGLPVAARTRAGALGARRAREPAAPAPAPAPHRSRRAEWGTRGRCSRFVDHRTAPSAARDPPRRSSLHQREFAGLVCGERLL